MNIITIHFHNIFNTTNDSHNKLNMEINEKICTSLFIKNFNKTIAKFYVLLKCNHTTNQNMNIQPQNL
jgi:hypothetical protein